MLPGAVLDAGAEFLAAAGKGGIIQEVKIALAQLDETEQALDRAEAGAEIERARPFFLHLHEEVFATGNARLLRIGIDLLEITQVIETTLAVLDPHGVEDVARQDGNFPAQHFVFRPGIAGDVDPLDEGAGTFRDDVGEIDHSGAGGRALREDVDVDEAARAITIRNRLGVIL